MDGINLNTALLGGSMLLLGFLLTQSQSELETASDAGQVDQDEAEARAMAAYSREVSEGIQDVPNPVRWF